MGGIQVQGLALFDAVVFREGTPPNRRPGEDRPPAILSRSRTVMEAPGLFSAMTSSDPQDTRATALS